MKREIVAIVYQKAATTNINIVYNAGPNDTITPDMPIHTAAWGLLESSNAGWDEKIAKIQRLLYPEYGSSIKAYIRASDLLNSSYLNSKDCPLCRAVNRALNRYKNKPNVIVGGWNVHVQYNEGAIYSYKIPTHYWNLGACRDLQSVVNEQAGTIGDTVLATLELKLTHIL